MSPKLVREILSDKDLNEKERIVFAYMVSRRMWVSSPLVDDLTFDLGFAKRTIERAIKKLEEKGRIHRSGEVNSRTITLAPPSVFYPTAISSAKPTATTQCVKAVEPPKSKRFLTAKPTATPPKNDAPKNRRYKRTTSRPKTTTKKTEYVPEQDVPPHSFDALFDLYRSEVRECYDDLPPASMTRGDKSKWEENIWSLVEDEGYEVAQSIVRIIVWDWHLIRGMWKGRYGDTPWPSAKAVWTFAPDVMPFLKTGYTAKDALGNNRGRVSKYAERFLGKTGGGEKGQENFGWDDDE